jgi:hypothetical protein
MDRVLYGEHPATRLFLSVAHIDTVLKEDFFSPFFMYSIQHCFICRPSDSTVSENAGFEPGTVATTALAVRRSDHLARSHPY